MKLQSKNVLKENKLMDELIHLTLNIITIKPLIAK